MRVAGVESSWERRAQRETVKHSSGWAKGTLPASFSRHTEQRPAQIFRYSLILFLIMGRTSIKSYDS